MGDSSTAQNPIGSGEDLQYEADLELAKRLSLETFESEKRRRNVNNGSVAFQSQQTTAKAWTRAISCTVPPDSNLLEQNANTNSNQNAGIIPPPPTSAMKRHRSLPYRVRGQSQQQQQDQGDDFSPSSSTADITSPRGDEERGGNSPPFTSTPSSSAAALMMMMTNDDLITLASPMATPKFNKRDTPIISSSNTNCDSIFASFGSGGGNGSSPASASSNNANSDQAGYIISPGSSSATTTVLSTNLFPLLNSSINRGPTGTSPVYPSIPNAFTSPNGPPPIGFNLPNSNRYGLSSNNLTNNSTNISNIQPNLRQQQQPQQLPKLQNGGSGTNSALRFPMGDDLIDLGQDMNRKILEFFDPLLSSGQDEEGSPVTARSNRAATDSNKNATSSSTASSSTATTAVDRNSLPVLPSEAKRNSEVPTSEASSQPQRHSLYPDLSGAVAAGTLSAMEASNFRSTSPYYDVYKELMDCDETSSIYDAYNPFDYLKTVSCSPASSTVASEFYYAANNIYNESEYVRPSSRESQDGGEYRSLGFSHYYPDSAATIDPVPPALPPRNQEQTQSLKKGKSIDKEPEVQRRVRNSTLDAKERRTETLYQNLENFNQFTPFDSEIHAFCEMLRETRSSCRYVDSTTNQGYITAATFPVKTLAEGFSIKIKVWNESFTREPAVFVCDVSTPVELVLEQSLMNLNVQGSGRDYMFRVHGLNEYLSSGVPIADFRYIQECIKLDQDVKLVLVQRSSMERKTWARSSRDDQICVKMDTEMVLPGKPPKAITYSEISNFMDVIKSETEKILKKIIPSRLSGDRGSISSTSSLVSTASTTSTSTLKELTLNAAPIIQTVKGVCVLLGNIQTVDVRTSLDLFSRACDEWNSKLKVSSPIKPTPEPQRRLRVGSDVSNRYSVVDIDRSVTPSPRNSGGSALDESGKFVENALKQVDVSVKILVEMYSKSFPVSFRMNKELSSVSFRKKEGSKSTADLSDTLLLRIGAVHRLRNEWLSTYVDYFLTVEVLHGSTHLVKTSTNTIPFSKTDNNLFFTSLIYDAWVNFEHLPLCILPRECRLVFTLSGRRKPKEDDKNEVLEVEELGWASIQCFNFKGFLVQGNYILPFWPKGLIQKRLGPAPNPMTSSDSNAPLISIEFNDYAEHIYFPDIPTAVPFFREFDSLDIGTQQMLKHIIENCTFTKFPAEDREILWEKRHYLKNYPNALPKVLLSARLWDFASLAEIHAMLRNWAPMDPIEAMQLLLPCFPDAIVRKQAIAWISKMDNEELVNMLPQLIEALSYETFDFSPLSEFLIKKSLSCLKFSHAMFWLLASQVGLEKWTNEYEGVSIISTVPQLRDSPEVMFDPKRRRLELMLNSLMISCGAQWKSALIAEYRMIEILSDITSQVKNASSSSRQEVLLQELHKIDVLGLNGSKPFPLPMSPSYDIRSIDVASCHSFSSASVPIKVNYINALPEGGQIPVLFKKGDDLRQDMLTIQIIRVVEKWWLKEGLDLRVVTFSCVPTGYKEGVVEMVPNSETLCKIQAEYGLTGAFQDRPIADWLAKMNPNTVDYKRAEENFTVTCAAYCVLTYVLGICDRHNDNIMLTTSGHLFHIDFGKFLGDAQRFGTFKRDRTPFVLTSDMVYVINGGEKPSHKFHRFVELCCQAFKIVRYNGNVLVNLFALMATAGIPGVDLNSVTYIQTALLPDCSNPEAAARFTRFIEDSLRNWFTPVNFFIHSLGQFKFLSEAQDNPATLSFVQRTYTIEEDGRIIDAVITGYKKKYGPEKYYSYIVEVRREGIAEKFLLNRSYKEFLEFYGKLCINFPMIVSNLKHLPKGPGIGRTNVKKVADFRKGQLQMFLDSLFQLAPEVSHSTLVYTFFHPLLRDEEQYEEGEGRDSPERGLRMPATRIHGKIKLSLEYVRSALLVLVLHAVDLACPNGQPPSPYVKTYLIPTPDNARVTKRKTRVVRRSQFPTFMEMIEYRLPLDIIRQKTLQVTVWHYDPLQENNFLGGVEVKLNALVPDKEMVETYQLTNVNFN